MGSPRVGVVLEDGAPKSGASRGRPVSNEQALAYQPVVLGTDLT